MAFKITANVGDLNHEFVFASASAPATSIEVQVNTSAFNQNFNQKDEAARLLRAMADRLGESNTDWPPV